MKAGGTQGHQDLDCEGSLSTAMHSQAVAPAAPTLFMVALLKSASDTSAPERTLSDKFLPAAH